MDGQPEVKMTTSRFVNIKSASGFAAIWAVPAVLFAAYHMWFVAGVIVCLGIALLPAVLLDGLSKQKYIFVLLSLSAIFVVLPVLAVVYLLTVKGLPAMSWEFISKPPTNMTMSCTTSVITTAERPPGRRWPALTQPGFAQ